MNQQEVKEEVNHYWFSVELEVEHCPPLIITKVVMAESPEEAEDCFQNELDEICDHLCHPTTGWTEWHDLCGMKINHLVDGEHLGEFELLDSVIKAGE